MRDVYYTFVQFGTSEKHCEKCYWHQFGVIAGPERILES